VTIVGSEVSGDLTLDMPVDLTMLD
jgi:hypothetical protein